MHDLMQSTLPFEGAIIATLLHSTAAEDKFFFMPAGMKFLIHAPMLIARELNYLVTLGTRSAFHELPCDDL
jgi:hypothetical protein